MSVFLTSVCLLANQFKSPEQILMNSMIDDQILAMFRITIWIQEHLEGLSQGHFKKCNQSPNAEGL